MKRAMPGLVLFTVMEGFLFMVAATQISVSEVIEKHIAAAGGRAALSKVNSRIFEGTVKAQGLEGKIRSVVKAPNRIYQLVDLGVFRQEYGFDGTAGWKKDRNGLTILSGQELEQARESAISNRILHYNDRNVFSGVNLLGKENIEGREAYAIEYRLKSGNSVVSYYDADTFLELKSVTDVVIKSNRLRREVLSEDYRRVDGVLLPFKIKQATSVNRLEISILSYQLNADVDDALFRVPAR